ncbi:AAA family ATPase [Thermodesulfobacteriota bacterium]
MDEIKLCILANYPILYVVSPEESRFLRALESFCVRKRRKMWIHSISEGLWNIAFSKQGELWVETKKGKVREDLRDPIALLEHLKSVRSNEGVFLLLDFQEALKDALVRRLLRDLARIFQESRNNIVILSPVLELPQSVAHEVSVLDFPLPSKDALHKTLTAVLKTLQQRRAEVNLSKGDRERLIVAAQGLTMAEFENCLAKAIVKNRKVDSGTIDVMVIEKKHLIKKAGLLEFFDAGETMEQVGGLDALKGWLAKRQNAFTEKAKAYGLPNPKGILLLGVQGCGKSLTAKACASLWKFPLLRLDTGKLFSSQVGSSEENARRAIRLAEAISPCVLWIDELEKAFSGLGSSSFSDAGTASRVFATLATWLQEKSAPVFVIATANSVTSLPPEMVRKGRWDEIFFLDLPGLGERTLIFKIHLEKRNRNPRDFDIPLLAENCPDYSGAEVEQAVIAGLYDAFDESRPLETEDILRNLKNQVPLSKTMAEHVQALREWAMTRARPASEDNIEAQRRKWREGNVRQL